MRIGEYCENRPRLTSFAECFLSVCRLENVCVRLATRACIDRNCQLRLRELFLPIVGLVLASISLARLVDAELSVTRYSSRHRSCSHNREHCSHLPGHQLYYSAFCRSQTSKSSSGGVLAAPCLDPGARNTWGIGDNYHKHTEPRL